MEECLTSQKLKEIFLGLNIINTLNHIFIRSTEHIYIIHINNLHINNIYIDINNSQEEFHTSAAYCLINPEMHVKRQAIVSLQRYLDVKLSG